MTDPQQIHLPAGCEITILGSKGPTEALTIRAVGPVDQEPDTRPDHTRLDQADIPPQVCMECNQWRGHDLRGIPCVECRMKPKEAKRETVITIVNIDRKTCRMEYQVSTEPPNRTHTLGAGGTITITYPPE